MGKLRLPKRIRAEDYEESERGLIGKISGVINDFFLDVSSTMDGRIDFANLNRQLVELNIEINNIGQLVEPPKIKLELKSKIAGINCIYAENTNNTSVYPISNPFVSYTFNGNKLTILNVSGLQNNSKYFLRLELIGF